MIFCFSYESIGTSFDSIQLKFRCISESEICSVKAEILWALKAVMSQYSYTSCEGIVSSDVS